jgi:hypothetical protein
LIPRGESGQAREPLTAAATALREMGMAYCLDKAAAEMRPLA